MAGQKKPAPSERTANPPYLDPSGCQVGNDLDHYMASLHGFASGEYPDETAIPGIDVDRDGH